MSETDLVLEVIEGLAEADGMASTDLEYTLSGYIDPEVLQRLGQMENGHWELTFQVSDHQVRVRDGGDVFIDGRKRAADFGTGV